MKLLNCDQGYDSVLLGQGIWKPVGVVTNEYGDSGGGGGGGGDGDDDDDDGGGGD
jgi:hypothetical protein